MSQTVVSRKFGRHKVPERDWSKFHRELIMTSASAVALSYYATHRQQKWNVLGIAMGGYFLTAFKDAAMYSNEDYAIPVHSAKRSTERSVFMSLCYSSSFALLFHCASSHKYELNGPWIAFCAALGALTRANYNVIYNSTQFDNHTWEQMIGCETKMDLWALYGILIGYVAAKLVKAVRKNKKKPENSETM